MTTGHLEKGEVNYFSGINFPIIPKDFTVVIERQSVFPYNNYGEF